MFLDLWRQAYEAMIYNRRRTAITMVGMAWGIATVVLLLAYGSGFGRAVEAIFAQWGTQLIGVFPGRIAKDGEGARPRPGRQAGRGRDGHRIPIPPGADQFLLLGVGAMEPDPAGTGPERFGRRRPVQPDL